MAAVLKVPLGKNLNSVFDEAYISKSGKFPVLSLNSYPGSKVQCPSKIITGVFTQILDPID